MTRHDHKNEDPETDSYPTDEDRRRKTVWVLGTEIYPARFWIICLFLVPLALVYRFGVFESAGLNSLQTVAIVAPVVVMALALAFTHHNEHYLHMALTERLASRDGQRRVGQPTDHREDERD